MAKHEYAVEFSAYAFVESDEPLTRDEVLARADDVDPAEYSFIDYGGVYDVSEGKDGKELV